MYVFVGIHIHIFIYIYNIYIHVYIYIYICISLDSKKCTGVYVFYTVTLGNKLFNLNNAQCC